MDSFRGAQVESSEPEDAWDAIDRLDAATDDDDDTSNLVFLDPPDEKEAEEPESDAEPEEEQEAAEEPSGKLSELEAALKEREQELEQTKSELTQAQNWWAQNQGYIQKAIDFYQKSQTSPVPEEKAVEVPDPDEDIFGAVKYMTERIKQLESQLGKPSQDVESIRYEIERQKFDKQVDAIAAEMGAKYEGFNIDDVLREVAEGIPLQKAVKYVTRGLKPKSEKAPEKKAEKPKPPPSPRTRRDGYASKGSNSTLRSVIDKMKSATGSPFDVIPQ